MIKRREFIKDIALGSTVVLFPELITSCNKLRFPKGSYDGKVIVIGAGAAGLITAKILSERGVDVSVLEASSVFGGRIRSLEGFASIPVELGAEEVHGQRSRWHKIVKDSGATLIDEPGENYFYFQNKLQLEKDISSDSETEAAFNMVKAMDTYDGPEITALQYAQNHGISGNTSFIADALVAGEFGTSLDRLSFSGVKASNDLWRSGNKNYFIKDRSYLSVLENYCSNIISKIQYDTEIIKIDYSNTKIILSDQLNQAYEADKIIVTVPLAVLQKNSIQFIPELPDWKLNSINGIGMGAGMKIILKFDAAFWKDDLGSLISPGVVPEYWPTALGKNTSDHLLTAFAMGSFAENLSAPGANAIQSALAQLDLVYNGAATLHYTDAAIMDWGKEPFIGGAYSFPIQTSNSVRVDLSKNINGQIYFAGEATNTEGSFATVHGAVDSGFRVAEEILN